MLNARRHRSGGIWSQSAARRCTMRWCSTPEGIGAAESITNGNALALTASAQRPKASERRNRAHRPVSRVGDTVLNARRHRSGGILSGQVDDAIGDLCSTPEGIGAAESRSERDLQIAKALVLNARRHRSGGIVRDSAALRACLSGAQRPKASERRNLVARLADSLRGQVLNARRHRSGGIDPRVQGGARERVCSTPEGIGAAESGDVGVVRANALVLNARRHRSGGIVLHERSRSRADLVLNARRHRSGGIFHVAE